MIKENRTDSEATSAAITEIWDQSLPSAAMLASALFGKYRSQPDSGLPASERSSDRKSIIRASVL